MTNPDFPDIEPLLIMVDDAAWTNPFVNTWHNPGKDGVWDTLCYFIRYNNSAESELAILFKSNYLTNKKIKYFEDNLLTKKGRKPGVDIFDPPYIDVDFVLKSLESTILDDVWCPTAHQDPKYNIIRKLYPTEQFCRTDFGLMVGEFFQHDYDMEYFTLFASLGYEDGLWGFKCD
jgi:hypothetical protein